MIKAIPILFEVFSLIELLNLFKKDLPLKQQALPALEQESQSKINTA